MFKVKSYNADVLGGSAVRDKLGQPTKSRD